MLRRVKHLLKLLKDIFNALLRSDPLMRQLFDGLREKEEPRHVTSYPWAKVGEPRVWKGCNEVQIGYRATGRACRTCRACCFCRRWGRESVSLITGGC